MNRKIGSGTFMLGDCLERMREIPDGSVDMVLCDLPYGTTQNKWDAVIPFEPLWKEYWRVARPGAAVVLTASQPFTTDVVNSMRKQFRYCLVWDKTKSGNFALAKKQPMKSHEDVVVFYKNQPIYNPQMEVKGSIRKKGGGKSSSNTGIIPTISFNNIYYPKSIITASTGSRTNQFHPTQKPVALFEYLVRTYTDEGMTVLDNCAGSGTTAIAAERTGRNWICIERDETYFVKACERVEKEVAERGLFAA